MIRGVALNRRYKWGVLGTSSVADQFVEGLGHLPQAEVSAVCARDPEKTKHFRIKHGIPYFFTSLDDFLNSGAFDILYIATPNHLHRDHCIQALERSIPVLFEKPLGVHAEEVREIINASAEKRVFCMEAMWMRFVPLISELERLIAQKVVGRPILFTANFCIPFSKEMGNKFSRNPGGGALLDLGPYPISLAYSLFGEVSDIKAEVSMNEVEVDETSVFILKHQAGVISSIYVSSNVGSESDVCIIGETGSIQISAPIYRPYQLRIDHFDRVQQHTVSTSLDLNRKLKRLIRSSLLINRLSLKASSIVGNFKEFSGTQICPFIGNGYNYEAEEVMKCLDSGLKQSKIFPLTHSLAVSCIIEQITESDTRSK